MIKLHKKNQLRPICTICGESRVYYEKEDRWYEKIEYKNYTELKAHGTTIRYCKDCFYEYGGIYA